MGFSFTAAELREMYTYFNQTRFSPDKMDYVHSEMMFGENFTVDDYIQIVSENREKLFWFGPETEVPLILIYVLIMMFGVFGNGLICYVIIRKKKLRTVRNLFIMNLAISDMVMCAFCVPFTLVKLLMKNWTLGATMCKVVPWLQAANVFASTITITAIALDRYQVIVYPSSIKDNTKKLGALGIVVIIWGVSGLVGLPLMIYSHLETKHYMKFVSYQMCMEQWPSSTARFVYATSIMLLQFVVPIIILIIIHWRICSFLKCRIIRNPTTSVELKRAMKEAKRHRKNSMLLMTIAIMFALCWFPLTLLNLLADFNYTIFMFKNFLMAFAVAHILAMISACINPIMYGWFNSNFRLEFTRIVCFWRDAFGDPERKKLVMPEAPLLQNIVFTKKMSYKAIQTEVQPVLKRAGTHSTSEEVVNLASSPSGEQFPEHAFQTEIQHLQLHHRQPQQQQDPHFLDWPQQGTSRGSPEAQIFFGGQHNQHLVYTRYNSQVDSIPRRCTKHPESSGKQARHSIR